MKKECSWCKTDMGTTSPEAGSDGVVTHGICDECASRFLWPQRPALADFLDSLDAPVVIADATGDISGANRQARSLLQKELPDIVGFKGGVVFECVFAKLPEGCGKSLHCDGCTIRNTVMDTFQSGKSHVKTPAGLTRGSSDDCQEIQFLISTEKIKDVVLLRIDTVGA